MSFALRSVSRMSRRVPALARSSGVIRRSTHTNEYIEEYNGLKENIYKRWTWNRKHVVSIAVGLVLIPYGIYRVCHHELVLFFIYKNLGS